MKSLNQNDLARIFEWERLAAERHLSPLALLSSAGGSNDHDADQSERLALLRKCIRENKRICKPGGGIYSDQELLSMPFDKFKELYDQAESDDSTNITGDKQLANDGKKIINLKGIFEMENSLTLLSARPYRTAGSDEDVERARIIRLMIAENKTAFKEDGFTPYSAGDLANMPIKTLRILRHNCQSSTRVL